MDAGAVRKWSWRSRQSERIIIDNPLTVHDRAGQNREDSSRKFPLLPPGQPSWLNNGDPECS